MGGPVKPAKQPAVVMNSTTAAASGVVQTTAAVVASSVGVQRLAEILDQKFPQCVPCETHVAALEKSVRRRLLHVAVIGFGGIEVKVAVTV